jgi:DoxX-like family
MTILVFTLRVFGVSVVAESGVGMRTGQERARRGWDTARRGLGLLIGGLWLQQGMWNKVLGARPEQADIVAGVPLVGRRHARTVTVTLGWVETALAGWVISRRAPRRAAVVQTLLIGSMNAGGWCFARTRLGDPRRLLLRNAALITLIWAAAIARHKR